MIEFQVKTFEDLDIHQLYQVLQLRSEVFVVEQNCVYQDIDGKDAIALHVLGIKNDEIVAYARCFDKEIYFKQAAIGRVVVKENKRRLNYGHQLMVASIEAIEKHYKASEIKISAQQYLKKFYNFHGFLEIGEGYLEDGIPHIAMIRKTYN